MSVYLTPNSNLGFHRPLTVLVKRSLTISNPNNLPIAFKVKTTAPKLYCVRPNTGRVEPGESVDVSVMLQALKEEPPLNAKCKDKFLIQSTMLTPEKEARGSAEIWTVSEDGSEEDKIHQQKLRVTYLAPEGEVLEEEDESQSQFGGNSTVNTRDSQFDTVKQPATNGHATAIPEFRERSVSPPPAVHDTMHDAEEEEYVEEVSQPYIPPPPPPVAPVPVHVEPLVEKPSRVVEPTRSFSPAPPNTELLIKLGDAQAEIERLRTLLAAAAPPVELRQRSTRQQYADDASTVADSDVGTVVDERMPPQQDGVPPQLVALIGIIIFLITYLFF